MILNRAGIALKWNLYNPGTEGAIGTRTGYIAGVRYESLVSVNADLLRNRDGSLAWRYYFWTYDTFDGIGRSYSSFDEAIAKCDAELVRRGWKLLDTDRYDVLL